MLASPAKQPARPEHDAVSAYLEELLKERPYYSDLVTMAVDPGPRTNPDMLVTLQVPGNSSCHWLASLRGSGGLTQRAQIVGETTRPLGTHGRVCVYLLKVSRSRPYTPGCERRSGFRLLPG